MQEEIAENIVLQACCDNYSLSFLEAMHTKVFKNNLKLSCFERGEFGPYHTSLFSKKFESTCTKLIILKLNLLCQI